MSDAPKSILGRIKEALGWATADRRAEAAGKLDQLAAEDGPTAAAPDVASERVLDEAELHVRADHADLAPGAEPAPGEQPAKADPPTPG